MDLKDYSKHFDNTFSTNIEFMKVLDKDQKDLFEDYLEAQNISVSELSKQMLVFGYAIAFQELKELGALK